MPNPSDDAQFNGNLSVDDQDFTHYRSIREEKFKEHDQINARTNWSAAMQGMLLAAAAQALQQPSPSWLVCVLAGAGLALACAVFISVRAAADKICSVLRPRELEFCAISAEDRRLAISAEDRQLLVQDGIELPKRLLLCNILKSLFVREGGTVRSLTNVELPQGALIGPRWYVSSTLDIERRGLMFPMLLPQIVFCVWLCILAVALRDSLPSPDKISSIPAIVKSARDFLDAEHGPFTRTVVYSISDEHSKSINLLFNEVETVKQRCVTANLWSGRISEDAYCGSWQ